MATMTMAPAMANSRSGIPRRPVGASAEPSSWAPPSSWVRPATAERRSRSERLVSRRAWSLDRLDEDDRSSLRRSRGVGSSGWSPDPRIIVSEVPDPDARGRVGGRFDRRPTAAGRSASGTTSRAWRRTTRPGRPVGVGSMAGCRSVTGRGGRRRSVTVGARLVRRRRRRGTRPTRRVAPRCEAAGCTWRPGRFEPVPRS